MDTILQLICLVLTMSAIGFLSTGHILLGITCILIVGVVSYFTDKK